MGQAIGPNIITNGLIFYWDFGNTKSFDYPSASSTVKDIVNNRNGTLVNSVNFNTEGKGSIIFSGISANNEVVTGSNISSLSPKTFCCWIYRYASVKTTDIFMGMGSLPYFAFASTTKFYFSISIGGQKSLASSQSIANRKWYYYCASYESSTASSNSGMRIYINGELDSSNTISTTAAGYSTAGICVGKRSIADIYTFSGQIASVHWYDRALESSEIKQNFNALKDRFNL